MENISNCPTCGGKVKVISEDEGTSYYEPIGTLNYKHVVFRQMGNHELYWADEAGNYYIRDADTGVFMPDPTAPESFK